MYGNDKLYSLTIWGTELFIRYPLNFNPYANLATPRIVTQKKIGGTNYQDSGICHSDGKFVISGQWLDEEAQATLWEAYIAQIRMPMVYTSYLSDPPETWSVIFGSFVPYPRDSQVVYDSQQSWTMELLILGKYNAVTGELMP